VSTTFKDLVSEFHTNNVFLDTKTIVVVGEVDESMFEMLAKNLHALDSKSGEITIKLMSDGGSISVARGIFDLITGCKNIVRVICYGEVSSAASIILQAADKRVMSPNSKVMIHVGMEAIGQNLPKNVDRIMDELRKDESWMEDIYLAKIKQKKPRFTRKQLKDMLEYDTYLSPKEALELGLIDHIGEIQ
jgi:ATP-dependent Clp protease, protease subunit